MADSRDSELVDGASLAVEVSLSDPSPELVHSPESPDGFVHVESSRDGIDGDLGGSDNQESKSLGGDEDDLRVAEDAGKEEMFVDCPDELVGNLDIREAFVAADTEESFEENIHFQVENRGPEALLATDKVEREAFSRKISGLRNDLRGLVNQDEILGGQAEIDPSDAVSECSEMVKSAREERLRNETTISELEAVLLAKNREIEELNTKVSGFAVSDIETVTDRLLAYYSGVVDPQELVDDSIAGKLVFVERGTYMLAERYNMMLYEIDMLRQSFSEAGSDFGSQDLATFLGSARGMVLDFGRKESEFGEKISRFEDENKRFVRQLDDLNSELGKTKTELEQETTRCGNFREKLTMAVTKGKALVQQRDLLKQSLAEKTGELEKLMLESAEKSKALEAAEFTEGLVASLQETLVQKNAALEKFEEMMSESGIIPEQLLSMDVVQRCRWIVDEFGETQGLKAEFHKVKDALSTVQLPETVSSAELEAQVHWVIESLNQVRSECNTMREEIGSLTDSLSAESREKDYLQTKLDDLAIKYEEISERENELSLERDRVVNLLLEASGIATDDEGVSQSSSSDAATLFEQFLEKIKEQNGASSGSSRVDAELFEKVIGHLYIKNQELALCELVLEEDMPIRSQLDSLSIDLRTLSQENESLQKKLEKSEEKIKLVRGKLTMAVNRGKGLAQERENLKLQMDEKNSEIEKINIQLQQRESELAKHKDRIIGLSTEIERIPNLEMDLASIKQQRDELENFLSESNNGLQRVIRSIEGIVLPVDSVFEDPVEKINWLAEYINECQEANELLDKQLVGVRDKASTLSIKLEEAEAKIQSLEESLLEAETTSSRLAEDTTEMEIAKENVEIELRKVREEVSLHSDSKRSLEEALSISENNLKVIVGDRESVLGGRAALESELEQVREEVARQTTRLTEAYQTIKSLEDALSSVQSNLNLLAEQNKDAESQRIDLETELKNSLEETESQAGKLAIAIESIKSLEDALSSAQSNVISLTEQNKDAEFQRIVLETELKKSQEETESQAGKLAIAGETIKSLEDALLKAENEVSKLEGTKKSAEDEISTLNLKLNAYVEESTGADRGLENRSAELSGYLFDLQALMNDNTLLSMLKAFEVKFDSLRNMDNILEHMRNDFHGLGLQELQGSHIMEEDLQAAKSISKCLGNIFSLEKFNIDVNVEDGDHISSFGKVVEGFQLRNKAVSEKLDQFFSFVDEFIAALLRKIQATRDEEVIVFRYIDSLKQNVNSLEVYKQEQDGTIASIENDVTALLSACTDVTRELQFEAKNSLLELGSLPELEQPKIDEVFAQEDHHQSDKKSRYGEAIEALLLASRKVRALSKQFESTGNVAASTILNLRNSVEEARTALHKAVEEGDLKQKTISRLEANVEVLQNSCTELRLVTEDYHDVGFKLKEREAEVEALENSCSELRALAEEYRANDVQLRETEAELQALQRSDSNLKVLEENYRAMEVKLNEKEEEVQALQTSCDDLKVIAEDYQAMSAKLKEKEADIKALESSHDKLEGLVEDYQAMEVMLNKKEAEVQALQTSCGNFKVIAEDYQAMEAKLKEKEAEIEALKTSLSELRLKVKEYQAEEADVKEKEGEVEALQPACIELRRTIEEYQANEVRLKERETEVSSLHDSILMREQETEDSLLSSTQVKSLFDKIREIDIHQLESEEAGDSESQNSALVKRLYYIVDNFSLLAGEKEELESHLGAQTHEIRLLKEEIENIARDNDAAETMRKEQSRVIFSLEKILNMLGGSVSSSDSLVGDRNSSGVEGPLSVLEKKVVSLLLECESSKSKAQDLGNKLAGSQKFVEELSAKVKLLEDSLQSKSSESEIRQERSAFEGPSLPADPEISEIEDVGKTGVSPVPLVAQMRTMRKGSADHLTLDIDSESSRLINNEETDEDKGHVFKSLNTSGLVPKQGKMVADRLDGMWVSGGRILMNRPRARIAVITYSLLLHIWLLATIL